MSLYGEQQIIIVQDTTDLIGIRVLVLSQMWQPSTSDPLTALLEKPVLPAVPGGVILVGEQTLPSKGAMRTTWTFQGINGDGKSVTFKDRTNSIDYGFEPGFAQVPIQVHPNFQKLLDTYGGYASNDGTQVIWPATTPLVTASGSIGSGLAAFINAAGESNPMFGIQDYYRMEGTYRFRYAEKKLPASLLADMGTIVQSEDLPGTPPPVSEGRNWLVVPPPYRRRGTILDITELYWLSGPGGWPEPVYAGTASTSGSSSSGFVS